MAMMAKMRSLAPAFIIAVGSIFVLFMVISDSNVLEIFGQRSNVIGSINGNQITYQEFSALYEQAKERQKAQTGQDFDEDASDAFNDQVWDAVITQELFKQQIDELGINVTNEEINDAVFGPNPPDFLKNQFIDSTGRFNRQLYEQTLLSQNRDVLLSVEETVRQMKLQEKMQNYLFGAITVSEGDIRRRFIDQNIKANAEYVLVDVNNIPDSVVTVSDGDLKNYYNKNIDQHKIDAQRKLKYILFSKGPSKDDSILIMNSLKSLVSKAKDDTADFKTFVDIYSENPYSKDTVGINQLPAESAELLVNAQPGNIVGPVTTFEGSIVYKLINKIPAKETFVKASHILIPFGVDENKAQQEAMEIYNHLISGADFEKLAKEKSTDYGSAQKGGDLGWFGKGRMVKEFEEAALKGKVGVVQKPVKTTYGFHIIKVTGRTSNEFVVEKIVNKIKASASTMDNAYNTAGDFAYLAEKNDFESEAELLKYKIEETPLFKKDAVTIPGMGSSKNLIAFAFENDLNDISPVFRVPAGYIVAKVSEIIKPGFKKFEEVKESLRSVVIREKKFEKAKSIIEEINKQLNSKKGEFGSIAANFQYTKFDTTGLFNVTQSIPKIGRDYAFNTKVFNTEVNKTTEPFRGTRGYYIAKVIGKTPFDSSAYSIQKNTIRDNILQEKKSNFLNQWLAELKEEADIVDNRRLFYR